MYILHIKQHVLYMHIVTGGSRVQKTDRPCRPEWQKLHKSWYYELLLIFIFCNFKHRRRWMTERNKLEKESTCFTSPTCPNFHPASTAAACRPIAAQIEVQKAMLGGPSSQATKKRCNSDCQPVTHALRHQRSTLPKIKDAATKTKKENRTNTDRKSVV